MPPHPTFLIVDDDEGHTILRREKLEATGLSNHIRHFRDGQATLDSLFKERVAGGAAFLVLLDIRRPKLDGIEVLRRFKADASLRKAPAIMLPTTNDSPEIARCHTFGCSVYTQKPVDYDRFSAAIRSLGGFVPFLQITPLGAG